MLNHVVPIEGGHRNRRDLIKTQIGGKLSVLLRNLIEGFLRVIDQIHLVDGERHPVNAHEGHQITMSFGLRQDAFARIDQNDRNVRR